MLEKGKNPGQCKVLVMGITFKEDVQDIRNSKAAEMVQALKGMGINVEGRRL